MAHLSAVLEMQEHFPNQPAPLAWGMPAPRQFGMMQSLNYLALTNAPTRASSGEKLLSRVRDEIWVQRNTSSTAEDGLLWLQKLHLWLRHFGTGKTAPEQISKLVLRGQRHPCPQPRRKGLPAQSCVSLSLSLLGLLICQGSSLRCRMSKVKPSSASCRGNVKHCHLPIPAPAVGQCGAQAGGFSWARSGTWLASHLRCILCPPSQQQSCK